MLVALIVMFCACVIVMIANDPVVRGVSLVSVIYGYHGMIYRVNSMVVFYEMVTLMGAIATLVLHSSHMITISVSVGVLYIIVVVITSLRLIKNMFDDTWDRHQGVLTVDQLCVDLYPVCDYMWKLKHWLIRVDQFIDEQDRTKTSTSASGLYVNDLNITEDQM